MRKNKEEIERRKKERDERKREKNEGMKEEKKKKKKEDDVRLHNTRWSNLHIHSHSFALHLQVLKIIIYYY